MQPFLNSKIAERNGDLFYPRSWVDYVLFGDVFIVVQGMDQSEMDLWWLMDCKKIYGKGSVVLYKLNKAKEQVIMAEACGVRPETCDMPSSFVTYYESIFSKLREVLKDRLASKNGVFW